MHETTQVFVMVDYVKRMALKSCKYGDMDRTSICSSCEVVVVVDDLLHRLPLLPSKNCKDDGGVAAQWIFFLGSIVSPVLLCGRGHTSNSMILLKVVSRCCQ